MPTIPGPKYDPEIGDPGRISGKLTFPPDFQSPALHEENKEARKAARLWAEVKRTGRQVKYLRRSIIILALALGASGIIQTAAIIYRALTNS